MVDKAAFVGTVAGKLQELMAQGPASPIKDDVEKNIKAVLSGAFSKMELLTRDEFDAQVAVLRRTRELVEGLETRVSELEKQLASAQGQNKE